jgi:hypothetical protein
MSCKFQILDESNPELKTCTICGKEIKSKFPPEKIHARCKDDPIPELPPLMEQAKNFGKSMVDFAADGFGLASEEVQKQRMDICNACDLLKDGRCTLCGCGMSTKVKISSSKCPLKTEEFPNGKWPGV